MSFYRLEYVFFGMVMGQNGECVRSLSRCEYKGTEPPRTMDEEYDLMNKQVNDTEGFDMDFSQFRYAFNYEPVDFDDNELAMDGETTRELMDRLSRKSLELYNEDKATGYDLVEVIKANYHMAGAGMMFFITFQTKEDSSDDDDDDDDDPKTFQAKVHYFATNKYLTCDLKPPQEKKVHSIETADNNAKKSR